MLTTYIALLRAINLPGHNKIGMADLRQLFTGLGLTDVRSVLQSGNLVFESDFGVTSRLENLLREAAQAALGLDTDFLVRTAREWNRIISANPFPSEAKRDPARLVVMLLKDSPDREHVAALEAAITGGERLQAKGRHAYIVYPDGIGRSRLTNALIERKLGTRGTARNWNTVLKLSSFAS